MKTSDRFGIIYLAILLLVSSIIIGCSSDEESPLPETIPAQTGVMPDTPVPALSLWKGGQIVQTLYGSVEGFEDESDTWVWKAVPYAKPPVGALRWKAPRDPDPWEGVRQSNDFCQMCPQFNWISGDEVWGSEDCLYLNIWRPQSEETNLPVYVYIHGGGNAIGCANQVPTYYGSTVARKSNMIFVSMNYRLGPFGWFAHPALRSGEPGAEADDSGNYGTLDIIKSLEWIQKNIEAFGGDPDRVIITGESAGGSNVYSILASPYAKGLFHTALAQSCMNDTATIEEGDATSHEIVLALLINDGIATDRAGAEAYLNTMSDTEIETYIRAKTPLGILLCYEQREFGEVVNPNIFEDGAVIIADAFENGTYPNKVPIMLGSTKEELKMFLYMVDSFEGKDDLYQTATSYGSDLWKAVGVDNIARQLSACPDQPEVYVYRFNWGAWKDDGTSPIPAPYDLKVGTAHSLDQAFFLGNPVFNVFMTSWVFNEENRPGREALTDDIMSYVAQFARTGNPNKSGGDLSKWVAWTNEAGEPKCILLDANLDTVNIEMSPIELTVPGILEAMKSEVPEPLYSEAFEVLSTYRITSGLMKDNFSSE